jgi:glutathione S-transferase
MNQAISILDSYAYRTLVWDIFVERVRAPQNGRAPDEARIAAALPKAETCLAALERLCGGAWLAGPDFTLADIHAAPMLAYLRMAREGLALMAQRVRLERWWQAIAARPGMIATRSPFE